MYGETLFHHHMTKDPEQDRFGNEMLERFIAEFGQMVRPTHNNYLLKIFLRRISEKDWREEFVLIRNGRIVIRKDIVKL